MAAPKGATYSPRSGPLSGMIFTGQPGTTQAYNRYQQARAHALGFSSYRDQRTVQRSNIWKHLISGFQKQGKVPQSRRDDLLKAVAENRRIETVQSGKRVFTRVGLDVDFSDHSIGGSYDMYLRRIGRRVGNEQWMPGETP